MSFGSEDQVPSPSRGRALRIAKEFLEPEEIPAFLFAMQYSLDGTPERVHAAQHLASLGTLPSYLSFFVVSAAIENVAEDREHAIFNEQFQKRQDEICDKYHFDPDQYMGTGAPPGYLELMQEFKAVQNQIFIQTLNEFGEHQMAILYESDPKAYDAKREQGRRYLLGDLPRRPEK